MFLHFFEKYHKYRIVPIMRKHRLFYYLALAFGLLILALLYANSLNKTYQSLASKSITDRHGVPILLERNIHKNYALYSDNFPNRLKELVVKKEDQYFWYHPGINPVSILRALFSSVKDGTVDGSSTISQQVAKILLLNTNDRNILNKLHESLVALLLNLRYSKDTLLTMYLNLAYLGNEAQGFATASYVYYGINITELSDPQLVSLLATLSSPTASHPWTEANNERTTYWLERLDVSGDVPKTEKQEFYFNKPSVFELTSLLPTPCNNPCQTTVDASLTESIRSLVSEHTDQTRSKGGTSAAVVIIDAKTGQLLSIVGSPDPTGNFEGAQINMAISPRPTGSTIKPFIYALAFESGARPYSLINDREYKYPIGTGYPLYPKNFDGKYSGEVTLHEALANSLNTPSVRLLEFTTLDSFYSVLEDKLGLTPINPLSSYAYGIALGGLEIDLLTLTHFFTVFTNHGDLLPLSIQPKKIIPAPLAKEISDENVFTPASIELVTSILTDRQAGVEQFGIKSTLDVFNKTVAVKTGTSRDFHDSWTIGYTPDYIVGVWLGNPENKPLDKISGAAGAGALWRKVIERLNTTKYNTNTQFIYEETELINIEGNSYRSIPDEIPQEHRSLLLDKQIILLPHHGDSFLFREGDVITFTSDQISTWKVDGYIVGQGKTANWQPAMPGVYGVSATTEDNKEEEITIEVVADATLLP